MFNKNTIFYVAILICLSSQVQSETIYINDKFQIGLHQEKNIDSVIIKLINSGTALDVIKKDEPMTKVRDPDGDIGWVDNQYIVTTEPGRNRLSVAEQRIRELEQKLAVLSSDQDSLQSVPREDLPDQGDIQKENDELKQLLKSERLRVGELQAETAELKNKLSGITIASSKEELEKLKLENARLVEQISQLDISASSTVPDSDPVWSELTVKNLLGDFDWKKMLITIVVGLLAGIAIGLYLMDLVIRRRHGGFRI